MIKNQNLSFFDFFLNWDCCRIRRRERREQIRQILAEHWALKQTQVRQYWHCQRYRSYHTEKSARSLLVNYWGLAVLHDRALRVPIWGSLTRVTGRCDPHPPPRPSQLRCFSSIPLKITKMFGMGSLTKNVITEIRTGRPRAVFYHMT